MEAWAGRVAVVTGAGAWPGREVASALLREGLIVVGVAGEADALKGLGASGGQRFYARCAHPEEEEEAAAALRWARQRLGGPHLLVQADAPLDPLPPQRPLLEAAVSAWRAALDAGVVVRAALARELAALAAEDAEALQAPALLLHVLSAGREARGGVCAAARAADRALCAALAEEARSQGLRMRVATLWLGEPDEDEDGDEVAEAVDVASALCFILTAPAAAEVLEVRVRAGA